jgi:hypothetical protein
VHYENLVGNFESESQRIIEYLGLDWQENILDFHKHSDASLTASAVQVRSPVHKGSVGKWKHYEEQLQPVYNRLEQAGLLSWPD